MVRKLSRRYVLRGTGASIALPLLSAMSPSVRVASANLRSTNSSTTTPVRMLWFHTESGMWMPHFRPTQTGSAFELSPTLAPLEKYRNQLSVFSGLYHENAFRRHPQTGRHVQDAMCHLTGADLGGTPGVSVRNSISIDQLAASHIGEQTRIPTLNLSPCQSGYLSFSANGTGIPNRWIPLDVFQLLFSDPSPEAMKIAQERLETKGSILDFVRESSDDLSRKLGAEDNRTLDEYLTNVRELERRVEVATQWSKKQAAVPPAGATAPPAPPAGDRRAHIRLLLDMLVLALQTDQTRLATFQIGFMDCRYPQDGLADAYHGYTHHDNIPEKQAAMAKIDRIRIEHLAYFLDKLSTLQEGEHRLLDQCLIHYGSGMGSWHESKDIANFTVGTAGRQLTQFGHYDLGGAPLSNLYLKMLQLIDVRETRFADSTGPLQQLA